MRPRTRALSILLAAALLLAPAAACAGTFDAGPELPGPELPGPARPAATTAVDPIPAGADGTSRRRVLAVSVDGLNPRALRRLGRERAPALHRLFAEGAGTRNARTAVEMTVTLPNHTTMVTGRRIDAEQGGHGVTWNDDLPGTTVQEAAGEDVSSVFSVVQAAGGSTALFATKSKFSLFERSWDDGIDEFLAVERPGLVVRTARRDLLAHDRALTFLHISLPDRAGHADGFMSEPYLDAVARTDRLLGSILAKVDQRRRLRRELVVVLTADHGGTPDGHADEDRAGNYRIPFVVWGAGVARADLYELNPDYRHPGREQPGYAGRQPVRNGDLANVVTGLLGLDPVPGSIHGAEAALDVG